MKSALSFSISLATLSTSVSTTLDTFLLVAHDVAIQRAFILFNATSTSRGTMQVSMVQDDGDGLITEVARATVVTTPKTSPIELNVQSTAVHQHRPIYLRIVSKPEGGTTPWWASVATMFGTIHFLDPLQSQPTFSGPPTVK